MVASRVYFTVFEHIKLKVLTKQFILDSLISLSFYIASISQSNTNESIQNRSEIEIDKEKFYSIEARNIAQVLDDEKFSTFFNGCKSYTVSAYKYNVIEYYPHVFKSVRDALGITEEMVMQ